MWKTLCRVAPMLLWASAIVGAQPGNLSGDWHLNVERSKWGQVRKPVSIVLRIEHREPELKYTGEVLYADDDSREFTFNGAVDGKEYSVTRSFGPGKVTIRRLDSATVESVMKSDDGHLVETARTILSQDGKTMTRRVRRQSPDGAKVWTEIYEKR